MRLKNWNKWQIFFHSDFLQNDINKSNLRDLIVSTLRWIPIINASKQINQEILIDFPMKKKTVSIEFRWEMVRSAQDQLLLYQYLLVCIDFAVICDWLVPTQTTFGDSAARLICVLSEQLFMSETTIFHHSPWYSLALQYNRRNYTCQ